MYKATWMAGLLAAGVVSGSASASAIFEITEVYAGVSGEDGTSDWIEVTNTGDASGSTAGLFYDDESLDIAKAEALATITLAAGESAVFLVTDDALLPTAIADFKAIWGQNINVQLAPGGGGLSSNGDTAGLLLGDGTVVDSVAFGGTSNSATLDSVGTPTDSVLGINGAYESQAFFNDNIGGAGNTITLIGSPGATTTVPEPASLLLAGLGGLAMVSRRR